jgi:hypothetical protein
MPRDALGCASRFCFPLGSHLGQGMDKICPHMTELFGLQYGQFGRGSILPVGFSCANQGNLFEINCEQLWLGGDEEAGFRAAIALLSWGWILECTPPAHLHGQQPPQMQ